MIPTARDIRAEGECEAYLSAVLAGIFLPLALAPFLGGSTLFLAGLFAALSGLSVLDTLLRTAGLCANSLPLDLREPMWLARSVMQAATMLGLQPGADFRVWVRRDPQPNAFTVGLKRPYDLFITTGLLEALGEDQDALTAIVGHELGHILLDHPRLRLLAGGVGSDIGNGRRILLTLPGRLALFHTFQLQEVSADRAALLACGGPVTPVRTLLRLMGGPVDLDELPVLLAKDRQLTTGLFGRLAQLGTTHPFLGRRLEAIAEFVASDRYARLMGLEMAQRHRQELAQLGFSLPVEGAL